MYFIQGVLSGQLSFVPTALPPGLYKQAGDRLPSGQASWAWEAIASGSFSPSSPVVLQSQNDIAGGFTTAPFIPPRNGHLSSWDVSPSEKATWDYFFDELDTERRGYIQHSVAVPFMLRESNLSHEDLACVWCVLVRVRCCRISDKASELIGISPTSTMMANSPETVLQLLCI